MAAISPSARLAFLLALFYLGWGKFLATDTDVYLIDYAQRIVIIALSWGMLRDALRRPLPLLTNTAWLWALAGSVAIILFDQATDGQPWRETLDTLLFQDVSFPPLDDPLWEIIDLTFGLVLVAVSEELVFRKLWLEWWVARGGGIAGLYLGSSVVFGLLHLPQGLADTGIAILWGLLLMAVYRRSGSLALVILTHYLVDFWYFA
ncbi:MAG TPA: hypothetical protein DCG48_12065 [Rhodospirillaceae bacterium]|nr:hypothetical protein [Rhodospirillaceae bacterium]|tara:strand:- start:1513 stop:2127 length:615 start_codon:yes stop_codon:yes gene_type:complete